MKMQKPIILILTNLMKITFSINVIPKMFNALSDMALQKCMNLTDSDSRVAFRADGQGVCANRCRNDARPCAIFSYDTTSRTCVLSNDAFETLLDVNTNCRTYQNQISQVWCDMVSNGGGYTFLLNDANFAKLTQRTLDLLFTDKTHYLLALKKTSVQNYCNVTQLDQYSGILFKSFLRTASSGIPAGYFATANDVSIGPPYLLWPVMTIAQGSTQVEHGIKLNGKIASGIPTDTSGVEHLALFPKSTGATTAAFGSNWPMNAAVINNCDAVLSKVMPQAAFFFFEMHFSGITYTQTDGRASVYGVLAANIGFK